MSEPEKQEMQSTEEKELEPKPQAEQGVEQQVEIPAEKSEENLIAEYAPPAEIQDKVAKNEMISLNSLCFRRSRHSRKIWRLKRANLKHI